jgi:uncharacterized protein
MIKHVLIKPGFIIIILALSFVNLLAQDSEKAVAEIEAHRKKQYKEFKDKNKSPLDQSDRKKFKGLNYYPIDLGYRIKARFVKNENPVLFKMKTTTSRLPDYVKYGEVHFTLNDQTFKLNVYQSPDLLKMPGYEDYLFIPFTDPTNGEETYEVGRYLELRIPSGDEITIDFNQSYNPYCSYSSRFSCPIPPTENDLPIAIKAGEKKYKDQGH